jgi:hypothetical protein
MNGTYRPSRERDRTLANGLWVPPERRNLHPRTNAATAVGNARTRTRLSSFLRGR